MDKLKILYYNWIDLDDDRQRGGGVATYQRSLVDAATQRGDEVWFLSSGACYSPFSSKPFLREVKGRKKDVRQFEIVNSPFLSPAAVSFGQDSATSPEMESLIAEFLHKNGPFDVVHFNNLEGIPLTFLRLAREHFPSTKIIFSMHNYFAFCPQVNLWFQERAACYDFHDGRKCVNCLTIPQHVLNFRQVYYAEYCVRMLGIPTHTIVDRFINWFVFGILRSGSRLARIVYRGEAGLRGAPVLLLPSRRPIKPTAILSLNEAARYAARRRNFLSTLNTYADHVMAVSQRVAELAIGFGIDPAKVHTLFVGTRFAEPDSPFRRDSNNSEGGPAKHRETLHIAFLGYMRRDKGFYFFLDALKKMPEKLARRLKVTFAAKIASPRAYQQIKLMAHRFLSVTYYDGYTHSQFADILSSIDLAVVPVMWEDNLPQVGMECVASGVPILTSDRGGAQELLNCPELVFRAGSRADFYTKLQDIFDDPAILFNALAGRARLYTPREHYDILRENYYRDVSSNLRKKMPPVSDASQKRCGAPDASAKRC